MGEKARAELTFPGAVVATWGCAVLGCVGGTRPSASALLPGENAGILSLWHLLDV